MKHRLPEIFTFKAAPGPGLCRVKGCRKHGHAKKFHLCHGHYQHAWRLCYEKKSVYATLRDHAKQRGIAFTLTHEYFEGLCDAYGFFNHKADEFKDQLSIDRVDCEKGYEKGNVRIISVSANSAKYHRETFLPTTVQQHLARKRQECTELVEKIYQPF